MKKLLTILLLIALSSIINFSARSQSLIAPTPLHDSIKQTLVQIEEKIKNDVLQQIVKETRILYAGNLLDNSLLKSLLKIDSLLVYAVPPDQALALCFTAYLVQLFKHLPADNQQQFYADCLRNQARLYFILGQYEKAMHLYEEVLAIRNNVLGKEHPLCATGLFDLGNINLHISQYDKADNLFTQALEIRKKVWGEEHPEYATILNRLAFLNMQRGQYNNALRLYAQALAIRKKTGGDEHADYPNSLNNRGLLHFVMGQYDTARLLYEQALLVSKKRSAEHPEYAISLNRLALLYSYLGQYDKALPLFQQALAVRKKISGEEHADYATVLNNLTLLYFEMGQYDKAEPLYKQALAIRKKTMGEMHPLYAINLNNLANLYNTTGEYNKSLPLLKQALEIRKKVLGEEHYEYGASLNNLANLYFLMGQYDKALPLYEQASAIRDKILGGEHPDYANSLNNLGNLYCATARYDKALPLFQKSQAIRKKILGEEHPDYVATLIDLANLYSKMGNYHKAADLFIAASNSTLKHITETYATLSEEEKIKFVKIKAAQFDLLPSILSEQPEQPLLAKQVYANELSLKGMVLEDQQGILNSLRKSGDSAALQLYKQWQSNKTFLGRQLLLPKNKRLNNFDSLQNITNEIEQQLSRGTASFRYMQRSQVITIKDIALKLQTGDAAIEFVSYRLYDKQWTDSIFYAALILLPGDTIPRFISLFEEKQLKNLFKSSSKKITAFAAIQKLYNEDSLYRLIWKPLEKYLAGINTIYFAPTGLLHRVAFQALHVNAQVLLIDKFQLKQVLSTRSVALPLRLNKKPGSAVIWANIQYGVQAKDFANRSSQASLTKSDTVRSLFNFYAWDTRELRGNEWRPLTSTKQEMESIIKELLQAGTSTAIGSGSVATEEAFKALDGKSPEVLHVATHGFFLPVSETKPTDKNAGNNFFVVQQNPMFRSGLVLAGANYAWKGGSAISGKEDGILTAYEIANIDLSNTDLVVLSACETALGDLEGNEGVIGLQRAFKMAGVKQLIVTLWRVPDKETAELMKLFYGNWLGGQSTREALRSAQLKMKQKYPSPYYWAAFVLME